MDQTEPESIGKPEDALVDVEPVSEPAVEVVLPDAHVGEPRIEVIEPGLAELDPLVELEIEVDEPPTRGDEPVIEIVEPPIQVVEPGEVRRPFQFSLRSILVVTTICCVILSMGAWLGPAVATACVTLASLGTAIAGIFYRDNRLVYLTGLLMLVAMVLGYVVLPIYYMSSSGP